MMIFLTTILNWILKMMKKRSKSPFISINLNRKKFAQARELEKQQALIAFKKYDIDGSGTLEPSEFVMLMKDLGIDMEADVAALTIKALIDKNGDGTIQQEEFIEWYTRLRRP